jgi:hypothetical protein
MNIKRGSRITIKASAVPKDAISPRALVLWGKLHDPKVGTWHQVMFNAGDHGVIFKDILDSEIAIA